MWKRHGMPRKQKRFASLKAAERRVRLLGPEPWTAFDKNPDEPWCCSGSRYTSEGCECGGETLRQKLIRERTESSYGPESEPMPSIEYIRIESRPLGDWAALNGSAKP